MTGRPFLGEVLSLTLTDGSAVEVPVVAINEQLVTVGADSRYVFDVVEDHLADGVWFRIDANTGEQLTFAKIPPESAS